MTKELIIQDFNIGMLVSCSDAWGEDIGRINQIKERSIKLKYTQYNNGRWYSLPETKPILRTLDQLTWPEKSKLAFEFDLDEKCVGCIYDLYDGLMDYAGHALGVDSLTRLGIDLRGWIDQGLAVKWDKKLHGDWISLKRGCDGI